jgi:LAO/AO transport system kinase
MTSDLVEQMFSGDRRALSRLISQVESRTPELVSIMSRVQEKCGNACVLGITGPPGAGKSTLVDKLISQFRRENKTVGVVAIDPSSPFSGGAVLGDRIRMQEHASDDGVFIRSLGSRGSHGGLSRATREVVKLYDAFGMDYVLVETVGVGQTELDIMEIADTTIVILTPESGDTVQTLKAGILEIADIFVVNKADRDGAHLMQAELRAMVELGMDHSGWMPPVLMVQAVKDVGVSELREAVRDHQKFLKGKGKDSSLEKKKKIAAEEFKEIVLDEFHSHISRLPEMSENGENPYLAAQKFLKKILKKV